MMNQDVIEQINKAVNRTHRQLQAIQTNQEDTHTKRLRAEIHLEMLLEQIAEALPSVQQNGIKACLELYTCVRCT